MEYNQNKTKFKLFNEMKHIFYDTICQKPNFRHRQQIFEFSLDFLKDIGYNDTLKFATL